MKTVFDETTRKELIDRINSINENSNAQWGKMNAYQMLKHCTLWDEWVLGKNKYDYHQDFLGRIFGKMALRSSVKNDTVMKKGMPAGKDFVVRERSGNVELQKKIWSSLISEYQHYSNPDFIHDFFGKMTEEQIGIFAYKHADHHLRQFNAY